MGEANPVVEGEGKMSFNAKLLRGIREEKKIKRRDLADLLGITGDYLYMLEKGLKEPGRELLWKIAGILGVTSDELLRERTEREGDDCQGGAVVPEATMLAVQFKAKFERERERHLRTKKHLSDVKHEKNRLSRGMKFQKGFAEYLLSNLPNSEKNAKLREYVIYAAHKGNMSFIDIAFASGANRSTILSWLGDAKLPFECEYAEDGRVLASFPGEAGLKLCCFDCKDFETGDCSGHGKEKRPENLGILIDRLEAYGIFNKAEQALIAESGYGVQLSAQEISEYIYRYRHNYRIPHGVFYFDPRASRKKR
jgi:transcriptional regulator with XRE-family HTH domain